MNATSIDAPLGLPATTPMPFNRLVRAYLTEAKFEFFAFLRSPGFAIPFLAMPVVFYLFFSSMSTTASGPEWMGDYILISYCVWGVAGPALFGFGVVLGVQRENGLLAFKRAMPIPPLSLLLAKMVMAVGMAALVTLSLVLTALGLGRLGLHATEVFSLMGVLMLGVLPFAAIGLVVGAYLKGGAAAGVTNLFYLPMMFLGGIFFPLPPSMQPAMLLSPSFHLNQVSLAAANLQSAHPLNPAISVAALTAVTVLCTVLAVRRLTRKG